MKTHRIVALQAIDDDQVNTPNSDVRYKLQPTMYVYLKQS